MWSETVAKFSMSQGWMIYAGPIGLVTGEVLHADLSAHASVMNVTSALSPHQHMVRGPVDITFTAQLGGEYTWDKTVIGGEPPNMKALLALARNHPEEYEKLREGEQILKALGG